MISLIAAASENGVIGRDGGLPWRLSDDLRYFKSMTMGKPVVMGRKTWESIGRPLPGRRNIVVSRQPGFVAAGCEVVSSVGDAVAAAGDAEEIMIIGGSEIYALFLPLARRIYLTRVHADIDGDATLPTLGDEWRLVDDERHTADERNEFDYSYRVYERRIRS
ncbi:MAG: type 3 dihydrofolate reductase [Proteobacteria bacterium]|nr:type 3 dihydrofolate reductase [Pseudomonadota bacterium]